MVFFRLY